MILRECGFRFSSHAPDVEMYITYLYAVVDCDFDLFQRSGGFTLNL